jgi:PRC-barrel domain
MAATGFARSFDSSTRQKIPNAQVVAADPASKSVFFYMKPLDSFTEDGVRRLIGRKVVDVGGKRIGNLRRIWLDPSTHQVEFAGVRTGRPSTHIVPARDI